jgi:predicted DCC family thiol-disulfide oxidoreductase YuxK
MSRASEHPVLLFDGVCNLCNGLTRFVLRRDPAPGTFRLAALQSEAGRRLLREHGLPPDDADTFVLIEDGKLYVRSTAALRVCRLLGLPWSLLWVFVWLPRALRDAAYDAVARRRYRWFGRRDACMVPTPELRARFLEDP